MPEIRDNKEPTKYHVFHDESGHVGSGKWFMSGLALVHEDDLKQVIRDLRAIRRIEEDPKNDEDIYMGEIHYTDLREFRFQEKSRVAKKWFLKWYNELNSSVKASISLFDLHHRFWQDDKFSEDFHVYNKATSISIDGFLSYQIHDNSPIELVIHSESKDRRHVDNFPSYIENQLKKKLNEKDNLPEVDDITIDLVETSNHRENFSEAGEVIQLVDLLLGSCRSAVEGVASKEAKKWVGKSFSHIINCRNSGNCPIGSNLNLSVFPRDKGGIAGFSNQLPFNFRPQKPQKHQKKTLKDFT